MIYFEVSMLIHIFLHCHNAKKRQANGRNVLNILSHLHAHHLKITFDTTPELPKTLPKHIKQSTS